MNKRDIPQLSPVEQMVLDHMSHGWQLIAPAQDPAYLERDGQITPIEGKYGWTVEMSLKAKGAITDIQRGEPVVYTINRVGRRAVGAAPANAQEATQELLL